MVMTFPPFLAGALAFEILPELGFDTGSLGVALGGFFGLSAISSVTIGGLADRIGWPAAMRVSSAMSAVTMFGIAALAHSWLSFAVLISLGGLTMAIGQPAVNLALAREVPASRQGFVFGIKHSAIPAAAMLSGLAVPLFAVNGDWRGVFVGAGVIAGGVALAVPRSQRASADVASRRSSGKVELEMRPLVFMAVGAFLAASVASALSAFLVISVVDSGVSPGAGGLILAAASVTGLVVRLLAGWWADARNAGGLGGVALLLVVGSAGLAALTGTGTWMLTLAAMLAFGAGWGWNGLFNFSVVKHFPGSPARATSVALTGTYIGASLGPIVMGQVIEIYSFQAAWLAAAAMSKHLRGRHAGRPMAVDRYAQGGCRGDRSRSGWVARRRLTGILPPATV